MDLLKCKRFQAAIAGLLAVLLAKFGFQFDEQDILTFISPILAYIGGQSIADIGKEKEKLKPNHENKTNSIEG